ncbi:MAG: hypothetical protein H8E21_05050 [Gammaproteobacteria bacterium]|nr:hypothetical protein [Gammaproteobacteria bacterium]
MIRKSLSLLLVALIALQSVAAIADKHQFHQNGTAHLQFDHSTHDHPASTQSQPDKQNLQDPVADTQFDCHHCCHCHGAVHFFLNSVSNHALDIPQSAQAASEPGTSYFSFLISPDLRPPIV